MRLWSFVRGSPIWLWSVAVGVISFVIVNASSEKLGFVFPPEMRALRAIEARTIVAANWSEPFYVPRVEYEG